MCTMIRKSLFALTVVGVSIVGCNGKLYTVEVGPDGKEVKKPGVTAYHLTTIREVYEHRKLVRDGKVIGSVSGAIGTPCLPRRFEKIVVAPDLDRPYQLVYEPGVLQTNTFGAELTARGTLSSVNTSSTPDRGETLSNLVEAATSLAPLAGLGAPEAAAPAAFDECNSEEHLIGRYRAPALQPANAVLNLQAE